MKQFLEYVAAFAPDFAQHIRGASPAQIAEFERLAGRELPPAYKNFLAVMGENDGGLSLLFDGSTNIAGVLDYYREEIISGNFPPPPDSILIGIEGVSTPSIALDCRAPGDPPVMFVDGKKFLNLFAGSLDKLLFNTAFSKYALSRFPWEVNYVASFNAVGKRDLTPIMPDLPGSADSNLYGFLTASAAAPKKRTPELASLNMKARAPRLASPGISGPKSPASARSLRTGSVSGSTSGPKDNCRHTSSPLPILSAAVRAPAATLTRWGHRLE